ncbi:MAG: amidohydrolase family protein [Propionibacteriales bacterium]|nr:amidohydrolase family protein [Propionibacteriales bacterium]
MSTTYDLVVRGGRIVLEGQGILEGDLAISDGRIAALGATLPAGIAPEEFDARGLHVLPGVIDTHTHWGYRGEFANDARTDSAAAAIGGTTTAHVLHRVPAGAYERFRDAAAAHSVIDFLLTPTVFNEATAQMIPQAIEQWGCRAFKFYLAYRDLPNAQPGDNWNELTDGLMMEALDVLSRYENTVAFVHAENAEVIARTVQRVRASGADGLAAWEEANPDIAEAEAIQRAAILCERAGVPMYLVHLSGKAAINMVGRVRRDWPHTFAETCPHYLFHNVDRSSTAVKFSPPVRSPADNAALWEAVADGTINCIGSDNTTTCSPAKTGDVWSLTRGGPGAGVLLPLLLSEGVNTRRLTLERVAQVTATNAAKVLGLHPRKGAIGIGADADLVLVDLALARSVSPELLGLDSDYTLYDEMTLTGWPVAVLNRGKFVARDFEVVAAPGSGLSLGRQWAATTE